MTAQYNTAMTARWHSSKTTWLSWFAMCSQLRKSQNLGHTAWSTATMMSRQEYNQSGSVYTSHTWAVIPASAHQRSNSALSTTSSRITIVVPAPGS
jgi:hypothetical protein